MGPTTRAQRNSTSAPQEFTSCSLVKTKTTIRLPSDFDATVKALLQTAPPPAGDPFTRKQKPKRRRPPRRSGSGLEGSTRTLGGSRRVCGAVARDQVRCVVIDSD